MPVPCATHNPVWVFCVHAVRAGGKVCLLEATELIDFTNKTEYEQNYLHVQCPTSGEYSGWRELLGLLAVTDMGSWLRETGNDCVKAGAHLNSDACVVLHIWSDLQEEGNFPPFAIFG